MLQLPVMTLLLLATHTPYINMAIRDPEDTILDHISELLNPEECHELYLRLAIPPKHAEQSSAEKDRFSPSQWQDISNMDQCKERLSHWLETHRGVVGWDRLARALRQIGRPDISRELKKSLNKNRNLEPKWETEVNQTREAPKSALLLEQKVPTRRTRISRIPNHSRPLLKDEGWGLPASLQRLFVRPFNNLILQQYIGSTTRLLIVSVLTGLILWLISVYYIICWNLRQCLFANGGHYDGTPAGLNMNLTLIWNHLLEEDLSEGMEDPNTSGEEEEDEEEEEEENTEEEF
ncbi:uncharacterized protein LOC134296316 [Anolis carolinensis]|uniref:uncharacterized protein LOC134296316 n=1 Tax=Anolis carolinensis TaxID=28377 RepID=UPI002F2B494C